MRTKMKFTLAQSNNLESVLALFADAIQEMNTNGINQWDNLYPDKNVLDEDIKKKQLYLGFYKDILACAYVLNQECEEQYANGSWNYLNSSYYVIHRLCVNPIFSYGEKNIRKARFFVREMCNCKNWG